MRLPRRALFWPLLFTLFGAGCGPKDEGESLSLSTRILKPAGVADIYAGLDSVRVQVLQDGVVVGEQTFGVAGPYALPKVRANLGRALQVKVDGLVAGVVVRTGRSVPIVPQDAAPGRVLGIYFSDIGSFSPAPSAPATLRARPAVATLPDGRVVLAGGADDAGTTVYDSIEIYDPDTGLWSVAGTLSVARAEAAAIVLADGRVLIAGGADAAGAPLTAVDLLTVPAAGAATVAASAPLPRAWRSAGAARLPSGKVVLGGGFGVDPIPASFDSVSGAWSELLNGVYAEAASVAATGDGRIVIVGGGDDATIRRVEVVTDSVVPVLAPTPGQLRLRRYGASAVSIGAGRVLVTGGADAADHVRSTAAVEIVDLTGGSPIVSFATERDYHHRSFRPVTRLGDGRLVLAGGFGSGAGNIRDEALVFDPATSRFEETGDLDLPRTGRETAVALGDGNVMYTGAAEVSTVVIYQAPAALSGVERVDFTTTPRLATRVGAASVLEGASSLRLRLYDVNSLVFERTIPGIATTPIVLSAFPVGNDSLYVTLEGLDTAGVTLAWGATAAPLRRSKRSAGATTILLGRVGEFNGSPDLLPTAHGDPSSAFLGGVVAIVGGEDGEAVTDLLDPTDGTSVALNGSTIPTPRRGSRWAVTGDSLLVAGGVNAAGTAVNAASLLTAVNSSSLSWSAAANMPVVVNQHALVTLADGRVFAHGSSVGNTQVAQASRWNGTAWASQVAGARARARHSAAVLNSDGRVFYAGGIVADGMAGIVVSTNGELYDPVTATYAPSLGRLALPRRDHVTFATRDGDAVICGGITEIPGGMGVQVSTCERFDSTSRTFSPAGAIAPARDDSGVALLANGDVLIVGGSAAVAESASVDRWNAATQTVVPFTPLIEGRAFPGVVVLPDGRVVVAGGTELGGMDTPLRSVETWTPATWTNPFGYVTP